MPPGREIRHPRRLPGVRRPPLAHVDDAKAKSLPGVRQVIVLKDFVAVVGDTCGLPSKG